LFRATGVEIEALRKELTDRTAGTLLQNAGLVIDTFDNSGSRRLVQEHCRALTLPCLHVGLSADYGEVIWDERYRVPRDLAGAVFNVPYGGCGQSTTTILHGTRSRQWPEPGQPRALSHGRFLSMMSTVAMNGPKAQVLQTRPPRARGNRPRGEGALTHVDHDRALDPRAFARPPLRRRRGECGARAAPEHLGSHPPAGEASFGDVLYRGDCQHSVRRPGAGAGRHCPGNRGDRILPGAPVSGR